MPEQDADIFEVLISQMRECRNINPVLGNALRILGHAERFEPIRNLLHRHSPNSYGRNFADAAARVVVCTENFIRID